MIQHAFEQGKGILRLAPTWVPRSFCIPGKRIKLHPDDHYAFGANRGGIDERWFSSTTKADNGPLTTPDEGLSYVVSGLPGREDRSLLVEAVAAAVHRPPVQRIRTGGVARRAICPQQGRAGHDGQRRHHGDRQ